jgi:signal transduction histidine kinase
LQIAREHIEPRTSGYRALASVTRSVRVMIRLAERLVECVGLEPPEALLRCRPLALLEFVRELVQEMRVEARHRGIQLSAQLESRVPSIIADRDQLQGALRSLLANTVRATAPSGSLVVALSNSAKGPVLTIRSSGCGIDHNLANRVPIQAARNDPELESARRCLRLHGATLRSESSACDGGTVISIHFFVADSSDL